MEQEQDSADAATGHGALALECFALMPQPPALVAANPSRRWMDAFPAQHAYRCLPLAIANAHGWDILSPCALDIKWNGGPAASDLQIRATDGYPHLAHFAASNFTQGIVTFHTGYLFRTPPQWQLLTTGPFNNPKHGIAPLTGIVETDWLPYPFTMNWQMTAPGSVHFSRGEPFCTIMPIAQGALGSVTPTILALADDPELERQYSVWRQKREEFMRLHKSGDAATLKQAWQKFYFKGELPEAGAKAAVHENKLRLSEPVDRRRLR